MRVPYVTNKIRRTVLANVIVLSLFSLIGTANALAAGCLPGILKQRLAQISQKFGPVQVISSHRPGARIAGSGQPSLHGSCRAVDFNTSGNYGAVVAWLKANHNGGVGTYSCGMNHIHIDNGPRVRFHNCVSANGAPRNSSRHAGRRRKAGKVYASRGGQQQSRKARYAAQPQPTESWAATVHHRRG